MPGLPSTVVLNTLYKRSTAQTAANTTSQVLHVICEFPLSGQYGLGSRLLYYILITACLAGNKSKLLKQVCLAAALIFPAVAAIHAIVLAALHNDGFVDMDIFGAFQLCSIGILVAPVTLKRSLTYWEAPGKKLILPWTILILTGLLSLTVEFCRNKTHPCPYDDSGQPTSTETQMFNYNNPPRCNITCSTTLGPFSRLRRGAANDIYVVPAPERITFGMGTLFSAGCCIPPVLYLVYMWIKVLKFNWTAAFAIRDDDEQDLNRATKGKMAGLVRDFLNYQEFLFIGAFVVCILVLGELNFFSAQVYWQTEPFSAVGQWATIAGPAFAVSGSWFIRGVKKERRQMHPIILAILRWARQIYRDRSPQSSQVVVAGSIIEEGHSLSHASVRTSTEAVIPPRPQADATSRERVSGESLPPVRTQNRTAALGNLLFNPSATLFVDDKAWKREGNQYAETPGEPHLNKDYYETKARYEQGSGAEGSSTTLRGQHSRSGSFASVNSRHGTAPIEPRTASREQPPRRPTLPNESTSSEQLQITLQRQMLEVPSVPFTRRV